MPRLLSFTCDWVRRRGPFFVPNLAVAALLLWLIAPYFSNRSAHPVIFGRYSPLYFIALLSAVAVVSVISSLALLGSKRLNRNLFLTLIVLFLVGEVSVRVFVATQDEQSPPNIPKPYVAFARSPHTKLHARELMHGNPESSASGGEEVLNELGFRGSLPPVEKGEEYRIIVLGGSAAWGGFPLSESIAGRLETLFHQDGRSNVRVYNWGVPGYVSGQELSLLAHTVLDYKPDLVIVFDGANDVFFPYSEDPRPGNPLGWVDQERGLRELKQPGFKTLLSASRLLTFVLSRFAYSRLDDRTREIEALKVEVGYGTEAWRRRIADTYTGNHRKMRAAARGAHFKLATFLQPMLTFKRHLTGNETSLRNPEKFQRHIRETYQHILEGMREEQSVDRYGDHHFFDLSNIFLDYGAEAFVDFVHVNNAGNEHVASRIYENLKEVILAEGPAGSR